jgi:hypothetical protein
MTKEAIMQAPEYHMPAAGAASDDTGKKELRHALEVEC